MNILEWFGFIFLIKKSKAFAVFLRFKTLVEKQSGCQIKTLRTYRGGEFIYKPFLDYCKENGIQKQLIIQYTPQQNGVAERNNRTIEEMARSMLKKEELPNKFWVKVVNIIAYIFNRSPTKVVQNQTPFEAWNKQKLNVSHLKVFNSIVYALIGYNDESKAFWLFNPKKDQLLLSKDVIFYESATWKWKDSINPESAILELFQTLKQPDVFNSQNGGSSSSSNDESDSEPHPMRACPLIDIYYSCHIAFLLGEPQNFKEAVRKEEWRKVMNEEMTSIEKNQTWKLVDLSKKKKAVGLKLE